jgi:myb proto-oncogene protein
MQLPRWSQVEQKDSVATRWQNRLFSKIDPTTTRTGKWTAAEDKTLKDGVRAHGGNNWKAITALVVGRTQKQCHSRWYNTLVSNNDLTTALAGKWTTDEDKKLKDAVREHSGKNWKAIAALVPGRTKGQCSNRWHSNLVSKIDPTTAPGTRG